VDDGALAVGLEDLDQLEPQLLRPAADLAVDGVKAVLAVDAGFPLAGEVDVRPVDDEHPLFHNNSFFPQFAALKACHASIICFASSAWVPADSQIKRGESPRFATSSISGSKSGP